MSYIFVVTNPVLVIVSPKTFPSLQCLIVWLSMWISIALVIPIGMSLNFP